MRNRPLSVLGVEYTSQQLRQRKGPTFHSTVTKDLKNQGQARRYCSVLVKLFLAHLAISTLIQF